MFKFSVVFSLLLTGTPIQNSLQELYSLLSFVEPDLFCKEQVEEFVQRYQDIEKESKSASELRELLQPFLLRRVKTEVAAELPKKTEVVLYHGLSALQKKCYKAVLMKDLDAFENGMAKKVKLQNILSQLRKCVDHPYLFDGVEPEPFEVGDHLIEASGKLHLLDKLLAFLYSRLQLRACGRVRERRGEVPGHQELWTAAHFYFSPEHQSRGSWHELNSSRYCYFCGQRF